MTIAIALGTIASTVVAWIYRTVDAHGDRLTKLESKAEVAHSSCKECKQRISDVVKTETAMKVTLRDQQAQSENVASALRLLSEQQEQLSNLERQITAFGGKLDTVVEIVRNGAGRQKH